MKMWNEIQKKRPFKLYGKNPKLKFLLRSINFFLFASVSRRNIHESCEMVRKKLTTQTINNICSLTLFLDHKKKRLARILLNLTEAGCLSSPRLSKSINQNFFRPGIFIISNWAVIFQSDNCVDALFLISSIIISKVV